MANFVSLLCLYSHNRSMLSILPECISFLKTHILFSTLTSPVSCSCTHLSLFPLYHPVLALQYPRGFPSHRVTGSTPCFHVPRCAQKLSCSAVPAFTTPLCTTGRSVCRWLDLLISWLHQRRTRKNPTASAGMKGKLWLGK